jgi:hypothetical protein
MFDSCLKGIAVESSASQTENLSCELKKTEAKRDKQRFRSLALLFPRNSRMKARVCLHLAGIFLAGITLLWVVDGAISGVLAGSRITVVGTLSSRELAEIQHIVSHEIWRHVLPDFSWRSMRGLPGAIRRRERILSITVNGDGTVRAETICEETVGGHSGLTVSWGSIYELKKTPKGWKISGIGDWIS